MAKFWFRPPIAPVIADKILIKKIDLIFKEIINNKGAIFCQVKITKHWVQFKKFEIWGNQKWKGAKPPLRLKAETIKISVTSKIRISVKKKLTVKAKIKTMEAKAWAKKYLIEASVKFLFNLIRIRGIILIKLISNPNQQVNQEFEEIAIIVPKIRDEKNIKW